MHPITFMLATNMSRVSCSPILIEVLCCFQFDINCILITHIHESLIMIVLQGLARR